MPCGHAPWWRVLSAFLSLWQVHTSSDKINTPLKIVCPYLNAFLTAQHLPESSGCLSPQRLVWPGLVQLVYNSATPNFSQFPGPWVDFDTVLTSRHASVSNALCLRNTPPKFRWQSLPCPSEPCTNISANSLLLGSLLPFPSSQRIKYKFIWWFILVSQLGCEFLKGSFKSQPQKLQLPCRNYVSTLFISECPSPKLGSLLQIFPAEILGSLFSHLILSSAKN